MILIKTNSLNSISLSIGNITSIIKDFMTNMFPQNFFRHVQIATSIPAISDRFKDIHNIRNFVKLNPAFSLNPEWEIMERMKEGLANASYYNFSTDFFDLIKNEDYIVKYELDQIKNKFNMLIRVDSRLKAWDIANFLNQAVKPPQHFFISDLYVPVQIPMIFIKFFQNEYALKDDEAVLYFIRQFTNMRVEKMYNPLNNNKTFVFLFPINIRMKVDSVPSVSVNKNKKRESNSQVALEFETYVTCPINFILGARNDPADEKVRGFIETNNYPKFEEEGSVVHIFHTKRAEPPSIINDMNREVYLEFMIYANEIIEEIDIDHVISEGCKNELFKETIQRYRINQINISDKVLTKLYLNRGEAEPDSYIVDWNENKIIIIQPVPNRTYAVSMLINKNELYETERIKGIK